MTSKIKVDNINKVSDDSNIINKCGTTITLGASGDTVTLASGASQTGFGRTGTVDWQTGSIKTATFTAANGEGYFCNTSGGAFTVNLPAGSAGAIVSFVDYTNTFETNSLTISANGSEKIGGIAQDAFLTSEGQSATFVYVDGTEGWKNVQDSTSNVTGSPFIIATGGTITISGNDKIHTFTGPGTFAVSKIACSAANNEVSYMVVAGGGGGGRDVGGGGAGGFREDKSPITPYTASPLDGAGPITVTAASFPITVGGGGVGSPTSSSPTPARDGGNGSQSIFSTITSAGGGGGGGYPGRDGVPGGSGGGASGYNESHSAGSGNTPPTSPSQGNPGGATSSPSISQSGGGGGGATATGGAGATATFTPRASGATTEISGSPVQYSQGGRGATDGASPHVAGGDNTGTGGDAAGAPNGGSAGGSGIVIIR